MTTWHLPCAVFLTNCNIFLPCLVVEIDNFLAGSILKSSILRVKSTIACSFNPRPKMKGTHYTVAGHCRCHGDEVVLSVPVSPSLNVSIRGGACAWKLGSPISAGFESQSIPQGQGSHHSRQLNAVAFGYLWILMKMTIL